MNLLCFTGNLGKECRIGDVGGTAVCNFSVAVKSGWGDKAQTLWIDCALWGKQAEGKLPGYLTKGQQVAVSGELGTREHEGKTYLTCRVSSIDLVGRREDAAAASPGQQSSAAAEPAQMPFDDSDNIPF